MPKHAILDATDKLKTELLPDIIPISSPPVGMCRVTNIYVDPETGKFVVLYDNTPKGG